MEETTGEMTAQLQAFINGAYRTRPARINRASCSHFSVLRVMSMQPERPVLRLLCQALKARYAAADRSIVRAALQPWQLAEARSLGWTELRVAVVDAFFAAEWAPYLDPSAETLAEAEAEGWAVELKAAKFMIGDRLYALLQGDRHRIMTYVFPGASRLDLASQQPPSSSEAPALVQSCANATAALRDALAERDRTHQQADEARKAASKRKRRGDEGTSNEGEKAKADAADIAAAAAVRVVHTMEKSAWGAWTRAMHFVDSANGLAAFGWHIDDHTEKDKGRPKKYIERSVACQCSRGLTSMTIAGLPACVYPGVGGFVDFPAWALHRTSRRGEGAAMWKLVGFFEP